MNNTLTAKEWVYKYNKENGYNYSNENCDYFIMEKYANYKNRILEDRIKEFRDSLLTIKQSLLDYREVDAKEEVDLLLKNMTNISI